MCYFCRINSTKNILESTSEEPIESYGQPLTFEKVWAMFQETDRMFKEMSKETDRMFKETAERFKETDLQFEETDRQFKETAERFKETDRQFKETDRQFKETDRQFKETDRKINKVDDYFTFQWGRLIESLVRGDLVKLLRDKGIEVESVGERRSGSRDGDNFEFDLIAVNTTVIVIVEVKTTLRVGDVKHFLKNLNKAKIFMPEYRSMTVYGGVAFLQANSGSEVMAESKGLFVIRATGSSASIINKVDFLPKTF